MSTHSPIHVLQPRHHNGYGHHHMPPHYYSLPFPVLRQEPVLDETEMQVISRQSLGGRKPHLPPMDSVELQRAHSYSSDEPLDHSDDETASALAVEPKPHVHRPRSLSFDGVLHTADTHAKDADVPKRALSQAATVPAHDDSSHSPLEDQHEPALPPLPRVMTEEERNAAGVGVGLMDEPRISPREVRISIANVDEHKKQWEDIPLQDLQVRGFQPRAEEHEMAVLPQVRDHVAIDIAKDAEEQQPPQNQAQAQQEEASPPSCFAVVKQGLSRFFNWLNPMPGYRRAQEERRVQAQRKAERKQQEALEKQRRAQHEQAVSSYFGAVGTLVNRVLGKDANLVVKPDTLQRQEEERLLSAYDVDNNRLTTYNREAVITAGGKDYHVAVSEKRKADPKQPTRFDYMYPTSNPPHYCRQDKREQEAEGSYPDGTILTFKLDGPDQETLSYDLHPRTSPHLVSVNYTEPGGAAKHERGYHHFRNSLESSDFRRGDRLALSLTEGVRAAMNRAEVTKLIEQRVAGAENQEHLKTRLQAAVTYQSPLVGDGNQKLTKQQRQALDDYKRAFSARKRTVETLVAQTIIANAELGKTQATRRRMEEVPQAQETLKSKFNALVETLNTEAPQFVMPEEEASSCWPRR